MDSHGSTGWPGRYPALTLTGDSAVTLPQAEYGYMVAVLRSVSEAEVDDWAEQIRRSA